MATLTATMPKSILSRGAIGGVRAAKTRPITPTIDPADYANDTEYLNAIPGMAESIIASMNAPASEFVTYDEFWNDDDV